MRLFERILRPQISLPAGLAGGIMCETIDTDDTGAATALTSTCAFFAIIIPLTLDFLFAEPLSQLTTAGSVTEIIALPPFRWRCNS